MMIHVELAETETAKENLFINNDEDKTETLQFSSEDNISLFYRVNSTNGDDDCVRPGNMYNLKQFYNIRTILVFK